MKHTVRPRRAVSEDLIRSGPAPPAHYIDESKILERLDQFVENPTGLREWLEALAREDAAWAETAMQFVKWKYPDLHNVLLYEEGRGFPSLITRMLNPEQYGITPPPEDPQPIVIVPPEEVHPASTQPVDITVPPTKEEKMPSNTQRRRRSNPRRTTDTTTRSGRRSARPARRQKAMEDMAMKDKPGMKSYRRRKYDRGPQEPFNPERARQYLERNIPEVDPSQVEVCEPPTRAPAPPAPRMGPRDEEPMEVREDEVTPMDDEPMEEAMEEAAEEAAEEMEEKDAMQMHRSRRHSRAKTSRPAPQRRRTKADGTPFGRPAPRPKKAADEEDVDLDMDLEEIPEVGDDEVEVCEPVTVVPCKEPAEASTKRAAKPSRRSRTKTPTRRARPSQRTSQDAKKDNSGKPVYEPFFTQAQLAEMEQPEVDIFGPFATDSEDPFYTVFANGKPVAELRMSDQNLQEGYEALFLQNNYPAVVKEGVRTLGGLVSTLNGLNARWYAAHATEGEAYEAAKQTVAEDMRQARARQMAQLKGDLLSTINLVLAASNKNYILQNALKDSLVNKMGRIGVHERTATAIVEEAWRTGASEYFDEVMTMAEEWLGAPPEALEHHKAQISTMPYRDPMSMMEDADLIPEHGTMLHARVANAQGVEEVVDVPRSVPIRATGDQRFAAPAPRTASAPQGDVKEQARYWGQRMNLSGLAAKKWGPKDPK